MRAGGDRGGIHFWPCIQSLARHGSVGLQRYAAESYGTDMPVVQPDVGRRSAGFSASGRADQ